MNFVDNDWTIKVNIPVHPWLTYTGRPLSFKEARYSIKLEEASAEESVERMSDAF